MLLEAVRHHGVSESGGCGECAHLRELFSIGTLIADDDRDIRDIVRRYIEKSVKPHIADWYETGESPARDLRGPLSCLNEARFGIAFGALEPARDCLETAITYAAEREIFNRPLAAFQLTQAKLADMTLELGKGMPLALQLGRLKDQHQLTPEQVSLGKLNNVREAIAIARGCRGVLGAAGSTLDFPILRHANKPRIGAHLRGHK